MKTLTTVEMIKICATSNCPICNQFMQVITEQTEENVITTSGECNHCHMQYMIDRSYPSPYELLGGHEYNITDR